MNRNELIIKQVNFCNELMTRLKSDVHENVISADIRYSIPYHTQMENDIVRLRRELSKLSKYLSSPF